ncbi:hypothetical protein Asppvi_009866 [Aspergillus pseudoviridinutans]|uniref:Ankyrin repeat-containing domain protein n=1 Tax=Aspergillus pseudoviridinutans TaxID=1517512 RepID=A0A9P3BGK6_9EURO|nr:uncharacterized protein Asppvi_009866 [Aspergillus pseudoviridinutans]GIJ90901.1 hypothetical protein Asppvi_009866 [Aspergillus pseudoviridinutans]
MEGVKLLVGHGVDLDMPSIRGMTPMKIAVECGHLDIASYLLAHGARVPEDHDFFVSCANRGYLEGLELVLDKGVSIDDEDSNGSVALFCRRRTGMSKLVIIDNAGSAITAAAGHGHRRVLEMLLDHADQSGCDQTMSRKYAFQVAMRNRHWGCAKELLQKGAETNSNIDDELPLSCAARLGEEEIAKVLLEQSPDQIRPGDDPTLLFWVVRNLSIEVLRRLLEQGLDPNAYSEALRQGHPSIRRHSRKGWLLPPLSCAMSQLYYDKAELLIDHGADPRPLQRGRQHITLVNVTRSMKCTFIAKMPDRGFNVNEKSDAGETPLSVAVTAGNVEGPFRPVLSLAIAKGHVEIADVLRKHGAKETCEDMDVDDEDYLAGVVELLSSA